MFLYETHCHSSPVSACAKASPEETVDFYKEIGYDGVFLTNHFIDGNIAFEARTMAYEDQIAYFFRDFERAREEGERVGIDVFPGVELAYGGTDFLIYGLGPEWFLTHPEIQNMKKTDELSLMRQEKCLIVQAHPYREDYYIDHIRLFPRHVHAAEILNSCQSEDVNAMGKLYARHYGLLEFAGTDNHWAGGVFDKLISKGRAPLLSGLMAEEKISSDLDFAEKFLRKEMKIFRFSRQGEITEEAGF